MNDAIHSFPHVPSCHTDGYSYFSQAVPKCLKKTRRSRVKSALGIDRVICREEDEKTDSGSSKHTRTA